MYLLDHKAVKIGTVHRNKLFEVFCYWWKQ